MFFSELKTVLCGIIVGSSMLIPGLSGGTMAIILGIYDRLIQSIGTITTKNGFKNNIRFLVNFLIGCGIGIYVFSGILLEAVKRFEYPMMYLFMGLIIGSIPAILKKTGGKRIRAKDSVFIAIGFAFCILTTFIPTDLIRSAGNFSLLNLAVLIISGLLIAIALILPGISVSQMLLLLGVYDIALLAVKEKNFGILIPLAIIIGIGILLTTNTLEKLMRNHPRVTYFTITGFIFASVIDAFPGIPEGFEILVCVLTFFIGYLSISLLSQNKN